MPQQQFTPAGVTAKQTELNGLSSSALQAETGAMRNNFRSWISTNFLLSSSQESYLASIADEWITLAAALTAYAAENALPISLSVTGTPTTFKLIHVANTITANHSPDGFTTTGGVTFSITYS